MKILLINQDGKKGEVYRGKVNVLLEHLGRGEFPIDLCGDNSEEVVDRAIADGYTALMHRNEHGRLFADGSLKWIRKAISKGVPVLSFDFGYLDHYRTFMFDFYLQDLSSSIRHDWDRLPSEMDWKAAPEYVRKYRAKVFERVATADGSEFHGCVGVWMQWNADLLRRELRIEGRREQWEWVNQVCRKIRNLGFKPVVKLNIVNHSEVYNGTVPKIDPGTWLVSDKQKVVDSNHGRVAYDREVNWKMLAGCAYHVFMSSSVSHLMSLTGKPTIATGESWFNNLGIFEEPRGWMEPFTKPAPNKLTTSKWLNWWLQRQCEWKDSARVLTEVHGKAVEYYGRA